MATVCPICSRSFPQDAITAHANQCLDTDPAGDHSSSGIELSDLDLDLGGDVKLSPPPSPPPSGACSPVLPEPENVHQSSNKGLKRDRSYPKPEKKKSAHPEFCCLICGWPFPSDCDPDTPKEHTLRCCRQESLEPELVLEVLKQQQKVWSDHIAQSQPAVAAPVQEAVSPPRSSAPSSKDLCDEARAIRVQIMQIDMLLGKLDKHKTQLLGRLIQLDPSEGPVEDNSLEAPSSSPAAVDSNCVTPPRSGSSRPKFESMSTPQLARLSVDYGVEAAGGRRAMAIRLQEFWQSSQAPPPPAQAPPDQPQPRRKIPKPRNRIPTEDGLESDHDSGDSEDLNDFVRPKPPQVELTQRQRIRWEQIRAFIRSDDDLHVQVLLFQAIDLQRFHDVLHLAGVKVGRKTLMNFLDSEGINFVQSKPRTAAADDDGEGVARKKKKAGGRRSGAAAFGKGFYRGRGGASRRRRA